MHNNRMRSLTSFISIYIIAVLSFGLSFANHQTERCSTNLEFSTVHENTTIDAIETHAVGSLTRLGLINITGESEDHLIESCRLLCCKNDNCVAGLVHVRGDKNGTVLIYCNLYGCSPTCMLKSSEGMTVILINRTEIDGWQNSSSTSVSEKTTNSTYNTTSPVTTKSTKRDSSVTTGAQSSTRKISTATSLKPIARTKTSIILYSTKQNRNKTVNPHLSSLGIITSSPTTSRTTAHSTKFTTHSGKITGTAQRTGTKTKLLSTTLKVVTTEKLHTANVHSTRLRNLSTNKVTTALRRTTTNRPPSNKNLTTSLAKSGTKVQTIEVQKSYAQAWLIIVLCLGVVFICAVLVLGGKRCCECWNRRNYSQVDQLLNGIEKHD